MILTYINYNTFIRDIKQFSKKLPINYDAIIAIPRSGFIPAAVLSIHMNCPTFTVNEFVANLPPSGGRRLGKIETNINRVLIIDDSSATGNQMNMTISKISPICEERNIEFDTAVIYGTMKTNNVKYIYKRITTSRIFEWNIFNNAKLSSACVDIDGVVCVDPTFIERGEDQMREHILNVKSLHIPRREVHAFITNRLEKFRPETEIWLNNHDIKYKHLIMAEYDTPIDRRKFSLKAGGYGKVKADAMLEIGGTWFIESSLKQATAIRKNIEGSVFCTDNMTML